MINLKNKNSKIGIICHDAGGAEIISSFVKKFNKYKFIYFLKGPAIKIFKEKINLKFNFKSSVDFINECEIFISGSSAINNHEFNTLTKIKKNNKKIYVFLDHWVNYIERFKRDNNIVLPDEIWVGDIYAKRIAKKKFKNTIVRFVKNPYYEEIKNSFKKNKFKNKYDYLYLTEPIKKQYSNKIKYNEISCLNNFVSYIKKFKTPPVTLLRLHPAEKSSKKYINIFNKFKLPYHLSENNLLFDIMISNTIVGCETNALVVSTLLNKKTFSLVPHKYDLKLPYKSIKRFSFLNN